ncbi:beta-N-acetylhexosaminidase [Myxococcota bacterium]|nr:beta-N-acetylhexosaminidase [Myxococcota bacterium]MBU1430582.1 beta-N-acetylhexosaminidase [Myxococcota bacterium]MBU1896610.1 beta-N-acetylhexosaminidase [Myxococcota bacterium]
MADLRNLKRRIGQRIILGFEGTRVPTEIARLDEEWGIGGYILFSRNLEDLDQVMALNEELWSMGQGIPPFIGIDQEGGLVHRLPLPFTVFPDMGHMGKTSSVSVAYEVGAVMGRELTASGFNLNFAPVLDLNSNPDNPIIGRRAISADPQRVTSLARAIVRGLHDNAIIACGKHFPGHGHTSEDSHKTLPSCDFELSRMRNRELMPYQKLINSGPHLDMVMTAHVNYPKIDPENPATLSRIILQDLLRLEMGFKGLIVTDDLEMKAISERTSIEDATQRGLEAGVDLFMVCHSLDKQVAVLETLLEAAEAGDYPKHLWERNYTRVREIKARHFRVIRAIDRAHARELVGNREHQRISRRLRDGK